MQFTPAYSNGQSLFGAGVTSNVSDCRACNNGNNVICGRYLAKAKGRNRINRADQPESEGGLATVIRVA